MKGDVSNSSSGEDMDVDTSESENVKPVRTQRKASTGTLCYLRGQLSSLASRAGIKKSLKEDPESEAESEFSNDEDVSVCFPSIS